MNNFVKQRLFEYMEQEFKTILLDSDLEQIEHIACAYDLNLLLQATRELETLYRLFQYKQTPRSSTLNAIYERLAEMLARPVNPSLSEPRLANKARGYVPAFRLSMGEGDAKLIGPLHELDSAYPELMATLARLDAETDYVDSPEAETRPVLRLQLEVLMMSTEQMNSLPDFDGF